MKVSNSVSINKNIQTTNGMLYEGNKVKILVKTKESYQVSDPAGRLFWVKCTDISV